MDLVDITNFNLIYFILLSLSLAEFALQVTISDLSQWVLGAIRLTIPYNSKLDALSKVSFWKKLLKNWWLIASPIILLVNIHRFFSHMFACPYCQSFHYAWLVYFFILGMTLPQALLLAPLTLICVAILDKLHS